MADFPSTPAPAWTSDEGWRDPLLKSYSRSGAVHGRRLQPAKKRAITLVFKTLSDAERATLAAHYDANRANTFTFTWPDTLVAFTMLYSDDKGISWKKIGPGRWDATIALEEA